VSFSVDWLRMREPYDHSARSQGLAQAFLGAIPAGGRVLDLAGGTGSGARYLRTLRPALDVHVVDHDPVLLEAAAGHGLGVHRADLRDVAALRALPEVDGLQAQALLDLVSWDWLDAFVPWLCDRAVPLLAALTVDGRVDWAPEDPHDAEVQAAFRAHQALDRGFGASPGPRAAGELAQRLEACGWSVQMAEADWQIPASDDDMVRAMLDGTAEAARVTHADPSVVDAWLARRHGAPPSLRVGHVDMFAVPPKR